MRNAAVQNQAFPLAGLMYALRGIAYAHEDKAGITVPANASSSFSRRGNEESFETSTRGKIFLTSPRDAGNLCTSTRTHGGEFLESIKKGLPTIANPVYGYSAPAKSGAGIGLPEMIKAIHDAPSVFFCVVSSAHLFFSDAGIIRAAHKIMVGCAGASSEAPGSLITGKTNSAQSTTNKIGLFGGGYIPLIKEAATMLATTPTQNPQFIWLIAAVRRDMPTITAKIHHVVAESEREARRTLAQDHVCFFAGRIRLEVAA
ncbi:host cell division inhibitor Icd-like protein [Enterobacter hormaechei]|uniref:host cell division inhibitor Icd-like protein n=1 Tax=Enterobacter hormaechei TaxID=158836 RepID=UPI000B3FE5B9|nr:host cell division inhibitor Icd-like protein [Enterobacter hormaechei]RNT17824.1 host cell division inhibitor Icd-like protein [Enterobacter hormaechei subsp. xiangfangensis]RNT98188.1 host cell division inhibitor Icd-like protein [Enterobacter hormaechei subsp. xiangfangensis]RNU79681.1 host cell division inhibitor Icd-like protein [Enterobacter hormaechei subsp. xiangfangensis]ROC81161.1 host cell division inhibitor Icd-like protein [Enterobacter hormaechei subsp. xiangfangensis]ROC85338